jgi:mannose-6-phosphate isomerase
MYIAIDIGGTKTLIAVFSQDGELQEQVKFPTPSIYEEFVKELAQNVAKLSTHEFKAACVAIPGKIDRSEGIAIAFGNLDWSNIPIGPDIEKVINTPVILENDAKLAALSEAILLKKEFRKALYVTISTGIGAGFVVDGRLDPNLIDMEAGQMLLEHNGELKDWEDFGSGRAFSEKYGKRVSEVAVDDNEAWYWFARNIAIGLIDLIATLTPDVIIIGGGAGAHLDKFQGRLEEQLKIYENPMFNIPPIRKAGRAEEAVIYGCFELAKDKYG